MTANSGGNTEETASQRPGRELVRRLLRDGDLSQKAFAIAAQCAESDLSNALKGKQRIDLDWILAQDDEFIDRFTSAIRADRDLDGERLLALWRDQVIRAVEGILRMALATAPHRKAVNQ